MCFFFFLFTCFRDPRSCKPEAVVCEKWLIHFSLTSILRVSTPVSWLIKPRLLFSQFQEPQWPFFSPLTRACPGLMDGVAFCPVSERQGPFPPFLFVKAFPKSSGLDERQFPLALEIYPRLLHCGATGRTGNREGAFAPFSFKTQSPATSPSDVTPRVSGGSDFFFIGWSPWYWLRMCFFDSSARNRLFPNDVNCPTSPLLPQFFSFAGKPLFRVSGEFPDVSPPHGDLLPRFLGGPPPGKKSRFPPTTPGGRAEPFWLDHPSILSSAPFPFDQADVTAFFFSFVSRSDQRCAFERLGPLPSDR